MSDVNPDLDSMQLGKKQVIIGNRSHPGTSETHRNAIATADTGTPAAGSFWINEDKVAVVLLISEISFVGGSSPKLNITPWIKVPGASYMGTQDPLDSESSDDLPAGKYASFVNVYGCDLFAYIDNVTGSPTSFAATVRVIPIG